MMVGDTSWKPARVDPRTEIEVIEESRAAVVAYSSIYITFEVERVLEVASRDDGTAGFLLSERTVDEPYTKDYDALESPLDWPRRFDMSNWGLFAAHLGGRRVGGAAVAFNTAGLAMLEGRSDLAVLWDIRVSSEQRCQGSGSKLFRAVETWAVARGCRELRVETQNINVPACSFYARQGCTLRTIDRFAYASLPDEVQLVWSKNL